MPNGTDPLQVRRVSKHYGSVLALDGVSMEVGRAECVALIGESGSGKTTLLRCFNRLVDPDHGQVLVDGVDAASLDPIALRRRIGYVPAGRWAAPPLEGGAQRGAGALAAPDAGWRPARPARPRPGRISSPRSLPIAGRGSSPVASASEWR